MSRNDASRVDSALAVDPSRSTPEQSALTSPSAAPLDLDALKLTKLCEKAERVITENPTATIAVNGQLFLALVAAARRGVEDTERLDWFESERPRVGLGEDGETRLLDRWRDGSLLASKPTFREALDAARAALPTEDADA